ncbi:helix-turn-helix domain-containing protein [Carboxylicivirga sp. M1479]|uniref:helix-turn-helix domain-containing protein n=1 Tax=Carboxylicivirga sp. M1479 TaxID=2594476 RepID=UPI0011773670|nr:helix-turn-helix domain-containing protein [Carboxylicivirga sp. M1479]TRX70729.1 helix-turn-helix domain-containing protein [Carboxylicivirga sp. M1479]
MNVITFESEAYQALVDKIDSLSQLIDIHQQKVNPDEAWVNSDDVCTYLGISQRTLQRLRTNGEITYSLLAGKAYYTISEVKRLLENRIVRSTAQSVDELCDQYKKRINSFQGKGK